MRSRLQPTGMPNVSRRLRGVVQPEFSVEVPARVLGPMLVYGAFVTGNIDVPFATTESLLPESVQRGIRAMNLSGGCRVRLTADGMTRSSVFKAGSVEQALSVQHTLEASLPVLAEIASGTSRYLELKSVACWVVGRFVYPRFAFETGDAMGMNMVTIATQKLSEWIVKNTGARLVSLSSNLCSDKKAAGINFLLGRGKSVVAEVIVPKQVLQAILHTSARAICEVVMAKHFVGSSLALAFSFQNSHIANVLAGVFLATGQDLAQLVESSMGIVVAEEEKASALHLSATLPCLEVGTIGGGTNLPHAKRSIELMGCLPQSDEIGKSARKMAEIIAGVCLAGELSLLACLAEGTLAKAHSKHRKRR
jgi:hydroxymethylglutaryl-CoA reductase (NADPH)